MKPNQQQEQQLKHYLGNNLQYRETYAEFYDHIMAALEANNADVSFEAAMQKIISDDFGGAEGMRYIENKYQYSVFTEMRKKYLNEMIGNLKFPGIIMLSIFALLAYCLVKQPWFNFSVFLLLLLSIRIVPAILQMVLRFGSPSVYGQPKKSIRVGLLNG